MRLDWGQAFLALSKQCKPAVNGRVESTRASHWLAKYFPARCELLIDCHGPQHSTSKSGLVRCRTWRCINPSVLLYLADRTISAIAATGPGRGLPSYIQCLASSTRWAAYRNQVPGSQRLPKLQFATAVVKVHLALWGLEGVWAHAALFGKPQLGPEFVMAITSSKAPINGVMHNVLTGGWPTLLSWALLPPSPLPNARDCAVEVRRRLHPFSAQ